MYANVSDMTVSDCDKIMRSLRKSSANVCLKRVVTSVNDIVMLVWDDNKKTGANNDCLIDFSD